MTSGSSQRPSTPQDNLAPVFSESVPQRPDSPVLVIEPETLGFYRIYTALSAEGFCRLDPLDNEHGEAGEKERALRLQVQELIQENKKLQGENERLKTMLDVFQKEKKKAQE
ncbi:hypothetical protein LIER_23816 [Lithospermum erythrorhizon]|uniref:Uncharacterized protein n=1 Tax=Lithospermum erythrorhizon TaxID=34254 RepID=A0AAV3R035_LITER